MQQSVPPVIPAPNLKRGPVVVIPRFLFFALLFVLISTITILGAWTFSWLKEAIGIEVHSYVGPFHLTVLELHSEPNYFMERVRVSCDKLMDGSVRDMTASVWAADLKEAGIFETHGPAGEIYYRDGNPDIAGRTSMLVHARDGSSACDIVVKINTTSTNTIWYSSIRATDEGGVSGPRALPVPLAVTGVKTNWPDSYERGSEIPLANLGDYKIFVSVN
jgi:hypothetical protein